MLLWLSFFAYTTGGAGLIPGLGTKILCAPWCGQNKQTNKQNPENQNHDHYLYCYLVTS